MLIDTIKKQQNFRIVPADTNYTLRIPIMQLCGELFDEGDTAELYLHPMLRTRMKRGNEPDAAATVTDGEILFSSSFPEDEYSVFVRNTNGKGGQYKYSFYALNTDLYNKIPLKGDIHLRNANGNADAALCRKNGMDFVSFSVPDPKLLRNGGLLTIYGSELCPKNEAAKMLQFGGKPIVGNAEPSDFGECSELIRSAGGISVLSETFRADRQSYNLSFSETRRLLSSGTVDAFELVGNTVLDRDIWGNDLSIALWRDIRQSEKLFIPPLGGSGAPVTQTPPFGYNYSIVFASDYSESAVLEAIRSGMCAAVEHVPHPDAKEDYRVYGSFRTVMLTRYLLDHYFTSLQIFCDEDALRLAADVTDTEDRAAARKDLHCSFYGMNGKENQ